MAVSEIAGSVMQLVAAIVEYRRFLAEQQQRQQMQQRAVTERQLEFAQSVGDREFDVRSELAMQAGRLDPDRTREVHDQLYAQYRQDAATWGRAADPTWWRHATQADVVQVWRASTAWQGVDPAADTARRAAGERLAESGLRVPVPGGRTHPPDALSRALREAAERQGPADGREPADRSSRRREADARRAGADADANRHRAAAEDDRNLAGAWRDVRLDAEQGLASGADVPAYAESRADQAYAWEQDLTAEATHHDQMADASGRTAAVAGQAAAPGRVTPGGAPAPATAEGRGAQAAARAYPAPTRGALGRGRARPAARGPVQPARVPARAPHQAVR